MTCQKCGKEICICNQILPTKSTLDPSITSLPPLPINHKQSEKSLKNHNSDRPNRHFPSFYEYIANIKNDVDNCPSCNASKITVPLSKLQQNLTITKSDSGEKKSSVEKLKNSISDQHQSPLLSQPIFVVQNYFHYPTSKLSTKATNTDAFIKEEKSQQTSRGPSSHSITKMGDCDVGSCCAKYILCIFNFIFFILGSLVLGLGLWLLFDKNSLLSLMKSINSEHIERFTEPQLIDQTVYLLITIGVLMFVLGFLGYCGAMRESQCLLSLYGVFLIILLVLEIVVFVFAIAYQDVARNETEHFLESTIKEYKSSGKETDAVSLMWNQLMAQFQCCGINSYSDFEKSPFWINNKGSRTIPEACCKLSDKTLIKPLDVNCPYSPNDTNSYYMRGCQTALVEFFRINSNTIIGVMSGVILIQLFAAFLAFCIS